MGSPVSVSVANLVMENVTTGPCPPMTPNFRSGRDMSMTSALHGPVRVNNFLQHLIKFTVEVESDGQLPFLDILLHYEVDGSIQVSTGRLRTLTNSSTFCCTTQSPIRRQSPRPCSIGPVHTLLPLSRWQLRTIRCCVLSSTMFILLPT